MRERRLPWGMERNSPGQAQAAAGLSGKDRSEPFTKGLLQMEAAKRSSRCTVALEELEAVAVETKTVEEELEARELARLIEAFLDTLTEKERVIFMRRYAYLDAYSDIAKRVGISEKNVSVRLTLLRRKLKRYLNEREGSV